MPAQAPRGCCPGRGPTNRSPRPLSSKRPQKRPWGGQLRRRKCTERNAAPKRRRRKGGGDVREPQRDDVAQAGRDHEAQEQGAARAADDRTGRDAVRRRHPPEGEMRGGRPPGWPWATFLGKAPCPLEHAETGRAPMRMPRGHRRRDVCCTNDSADRELAAADHFAHEAIAQRMVPGSGLLRHSARRGHGDQGHRPKHGVGINRHRAAKRR